VPGPTVGRIRGTEATMAWIAKQSGGARVERSERAYLTRQMKERLTAEVLPRYQTPQGALMPVLHAVQHAHGWVAEQAMLEVAEFLGLAPAVVMDAASFYEEYWLEPKGRHVVAICRSVACEFCGQPAITDACCRHMGIEVGETTDDGRFTLIELECLGACGGAPALLIDETLHEGIRPEDVAALIDAVANGGDEGTGSPAAGKQ